MVEGVEWSGQGVWNVVRERIEVGSGKWKWK
jgi:hypothetical protein